MIKFDTSQGFFAYVSLRLRMTRGEIRTMYPQTVAAAFSPRTSAHSKGCGYIG